MLKKYFGKALSPNEMKAIQGGCPPPGCAGGLRFMCCPDISTWSTAGQCENYCNTHFNASCVDTEVEAC